MARPGLFADVPHSHVFAWTMGLLAGVTTMMANAAGPIFVLYALAVGLPKYELVGTGAWFFSHRESVEGALERRDSA